jgi:hypothetical protein
MNHNLQPIKKHPISKLLERTEERHLHIISRIVCRYVVLLVKSFGMMHKFYESLHLYFCIIHSACFALLLYLEMKTGILWNILHKNYYR